MGWTIQEVEQTPVQMGEVILEGNLEADDTGGTTVKVGNIGGTTLDAGDIDWASLEAGNIGRTALEAESLETGK